MRVPDFKLVAAICDTGDEQLPDPLVGMLAHGVAAAVPVIEIANHADPARIGRPDGKQRTLDLIDAVPARTQHTLCIAMMALMECIHLLLLQLRPETVGIKNFTLFPVFTVPMIR